MSKRAGGTGELADEMTRRAVVGVEGDKERKQRKRGAGSASLEEKSAALLSRACGVD